jgi:hypothetical protein
MGGIPIEFTSRHFPELHGQTVVACQYCPREAKFELVTRHWERFGGNEPAFLRLLFLGVKNFVRVRGDLKLPGHDWGERYSARDTYGAVAVESVATESRLLLGSNRHKILLRFGSSDGSCEFDYERFEAYVRPINLDAAGGLGQRFDASTGESVDYYAPFAGGADDAPGAR